VRREPPGVRLPPSPPDDHETGRTSGGNPAG